MGVSSRPSKEDAYIHVNGDVGFASRCSDTSFCSAESVRSNNQGRVGAYAYRRVFVLFYEA